MKIVIPGGSGQVGTILARHFQAQGHDVVVLSRSPRPAPWRVVQWDGESLGPWVSELEGAEVVFNLAGRIVNCRYGYRNRCDIWSSRSRSVRVIGSAINQMTSPPRVWLQAGTATIYAHRFDAANDEYTGVIGGVEPAVPDTWRFSIDVARAWEGEFALVSTPQTRKVLLRSAMTMSHDRGGIFDTLLRLVRCGLGGAAASGEQFISWIHYIDFIRAVELLIEHEEISGAVNVCSPQPVPNREFMKQLREAWGQRYGLQLARWMIEVGALMLRTESELVLKSRRVAPGRLTEAGFIFEYPDWAEASRDLCKRSRAKV